MDLRITAAALDFYVDVRLRSFGAKQADGSGERWLAIADIGGAHEIGLGRDLREALTASLASLGAAATVALLADPQLSDVIQEP